MLGRFSSVLLGLAFGLAVSVVNHIILRQGINKGAKLPPHKGTNIILMRYGIRCILDVVALFLVHRNIPMLIATAFGLMGNKYYQIVRNLYKDHTSKGMN